MRPAFNITQRNKNNENLLSIISIHFSNNQNLSLLKLPIKLVIKTNCLLCQPRQPSSHFPGAWPPLIFLPWLLTLVAGVVDPRHNEKNNSQAGDGLQRSKRPRCRSKQSRGSNVTLEPMWGSEAVRVHRPHPASTIPSIALGRKDGSLLESVLPKFTCFPKPRASKYPALLPSTPALLQPLGPCRPTIKIG